MVINPPRGIVTVPAIMALTGGYKVLINLLMLWLMESGIGACTATMDFGGMVEDNNIEPYNYLSANSLIS